MAINYNSRNVHANESSEIPTSSIKQDTGASSSKPKTKALARHVNLSLFGTWENYLRAEKLKGATTAELLQRGISASNLFQGGISLRDLVQAKAPTADLLKIASASELLKSGISVKNLRKVNAADSLIQTRLKAAWKTAKGSVEPFLKTVEPLYMTDEKGLVDFDTLSDCLKFLQKNCTSTFSFQLQKFQIYFRNLIQNNSEFLESETGVIDAAKFENWLLFLVRDKTNPRIEVEEFLRICPPSLSQFDFGQLKKVHAPENLPVQEQLKEQLYELLLNIINEDAQDEPSQVTLSQLVDMGAALKKTNTTNGADAFLNSMKMHQSDYTFLKDGIALIDKSLELFYPTNLHCKAQEIATTAFKEALKGSLDMTHTVILTLIKDKKEKIEKLMGLLTRFETQAIRYTQMAESSEKKALRKALEAIKHCYGTESKKPDFFTIVEKVQVDAEAIYDPSPEGLSNMFGDSFTTSTP